MILIGASGHAKVIIDILEKSGNTVDRLYDTNPEVTALSGKLVKLQSEFEPTDGDQVIISIGSNRIRKRIVFRWEQTLL